jgi:hypothetical protein
VSPAVLSVTAVPVLEAHRANSFDMSNVRCRVTIAETNDGREHVLFMTSARRLQLAVGGVTIRGRSRLLTDAIVPPRETEIRTRLMRQLAALAITHDLSERLHPGDPRAPRLRFVLQVLDASLAMASQRDTALTLLGRERVATDWNDPGGHLRDRIRRALRRGRQLMRGGYLELLR